LSVSFPTFCRCYITLCYAIYDLYVHRLARPLSRISARSSPRTNSFLLTYPAYLSLALTSFAFISFSQRCLSRVLILFEDVSFVSSLSRSHVFQWFPTGLSFCFTFPALPSSSIYLLLTKHACVMHVLQYLFCIYICRFYLSVAFHACLCL